MDDGATWTPIGSGLGSNLVFSLAEDGSVLFAGTPFGVYRSETNGVTWTPDHAGIENAPVNRIAVGANRLLAGTDRGLFRRADGETVWAKRNAGLLAQTVTAMATIGTELYVATPGDGVYRSPDNGASWVQINDGLGHPGVLALAAKGNDLFAATFAGVYRLPGNGTTWEYAHNGLTQTVVSLAVSETTLLAGTFEGGVFRSTNNGASWTASAIQAGGLSVSVLTTDGSSVYAGTRGAGIFRSTDAGNTWTQLQNSFTVTALAAIGPTILAGTENGGAYRSLNAGATWAPLSLLGASSFAIRSAEIFAAGFGVFRSDNGGDSWSSYDDGLPRPPSHLLLLGDKLFAGGAGPVYVRQTTGTCPATVAVMPGNQSVCPGASVTFTAGAAGAGSGYQWRKNGVPINGATGSSFTIASAVSGDAGSYDVLVTGACGGPISNAVTLSVAGFTLAPTGQSLPAGSGGGSVTVSTDGACNWTAASNDPWIAITSGASGSGNGTVQYTVAANSGGARTGTLTIAGQTFAVTQSAAAVGLQFYPLARPVRLLDTRQGASPNACHQPNGQIPGGTSRTQPAKGLCEGLSIPADAAAITGNITTVQSGGGFLTLYPSDVSRPTVANSNYNPNEILNNVFTVGLGAADGAFMIYVTTNTDVVIDITGYYAPPGAGGLYFHPLPKPARLLDTRAGFAACYAPGAPLPGATATTQPATGASSYCCLPPIFLATLSLRPGACLAVATLTLAMTPTLMSRVCFVAALRMASVCRARVGEFLASSRINSPWPPMTINKLLKSCATPPASRPTASIFCAWRSCSSSTRRSVTSRCVPQMRSSLPPSMMRRTNGCVL